MKSKIATHTPGEWKQSDYDETIIIGPNGEHIAEVAKPANARLIAAAPDMKASLQMIDDLGNVDGTFTNDELLALIEQMREEARPAIPRTKSEVK